MTALLFCANILLLMMWGVVAADEFAPPAKAPTDAQVRFFETRIRPLLAENCFQCHGPDKQKGNLRLDSRAALLAGGDLGEAVTLDAPETSLLLKAIGYQDDSLKMPPKGKLSDQQLADLVTWVKAGAPFPAETIAVDDKAKSPASRSGADFWSFQRPIEQPLPVVHDDNWVRTPIDRFILASLESAGLRPAVAADKRTLIRRATFDLLGLPPAPPEVEDFLADDSPQAFASVVDRLLASPHYGQRWGRHWLDVVRYADSNGLDENVAFGNAWRYRDYVVAAFNRDKPYDQFLLEQLAGDRLPASESSSADDLAARHERLIATGFLALGPKVLAEVDATKMEMDIIDEQVDTLGRAILGLTLGCARCHDHKFDPIRTDDYYALAGIFKSTRIMENFIKLARWYENDLGTEEELARKAAHQQQLAERKTAIDEFVKQANQRLQASLPDGVLPNDPQSQYPEETKAELKRLRDESAEFQKNAPVVPSAMGASEGAIADLAIHIRGNHLTLGKTIARGFPQVLAATQAVSIDPTRSGRLELAQWLVSTDHPLTSRVMVNRLWRWHFGEGLVRSPDNFGRLGEAPTNQPLLDWLARRFIESRWSIKDMHRLIMLSSVYQMSSTHDAGAAAVDPGNRLHWRMDVRRLEAEEIRDALHAVAGTLDRTIGGSLLHVANREYLFDHTSKDATTYDSSRRALYLPVVRNNLYDVYQLFDSPDGTVLNGDRAATTVPTQALFMLNSDLVAQSAEHLADNLLARNAADDAQRLDALYLLVYARPTEGSERARDLALLQKFDNAAADQEPDPAKRSQHAWARLCHVLLAANEFIYLN
jgi:mono/diheme cytochrome c family protein